MAHIGVPCSKADPCSIHRPRRYGWQPEHYEAMVEWVEQGQKFTPSSLAKQFAPSFGFNHWDLARDVVEDMAKHGLIDCIKRGRNGYCYGWVARKEIHGT